MGDTMNLVMENGGEWCNLNKTTTHVVSNDWNPQRRSFIWGKKYGLPFVRDAWLLDSIISGRVMDVNDYLLPDPSEAGREGASSSSSTTSTGTKRGRASSKTSTTTTTTGTISNKKQKGLKKEAEEEAEEEVGEKKEQKEKKELKASLHNALEAARKAREQTPVVIKQGSPGFPLDGTSELFEVMAPNIKHQRNATLMKILADYITEVFKEHGLKHESDNKKKPSTIGVGRTKIVVPPVEEDFQKAHLDVFTEISYGGPAIVREYDKKQ